MSSLDEKTVLDMLENVSKSVVNISTVRHVYRMFYQPIPVEGMGSGTIIDANGFILTNNHVVGGAEQINVTLWNGEILQGKLVGSCSVHDTALIKVDKTGLAAAELGDSDQLRVGQRVYAIGNPFGLAGGPTVTSGVISSVKRTIESQRGMLENLVQTDAPINPGNSGGPLVDLTGKVVAMSTAIIPYAQGIGFAIPINSAKRCTGEMTDEGAASRPWLGIIGLTLSGDLSRYYDLPVDKGVLVTRVVDDSPAAHAGFVAGDIISEMDGTIVQSVEDLLAGVQKRRVGDEVFIKVYHRGSERLIKAKLSKTP